MHTEKPKQEKQRACKTRKSKHQDWSSNSLKPQEQATICLNVICGKIFIEPIELTVRIRGSPETYYACPHCFSRLSLSGNRQKDPSEAPLCASKKASWETIRDIENNRPKGCVHFLGYLKTRPKSSPIPDGCLTCTSIIHCMGFIRH